MLCSRFCGCNIKVGRLRSVHLPGIGSIGHKWGQRRPFIRQIGIRQSMLSSIFFVAACHQIFHQTSIDAGWETGCQCHTTHLVSIDNSHLQTAPNIGPQGSYVFIDQTFSVIKAYTDPPALITRNPRQRSQSFLTCYAVSSDRCGIQYISNP